MSKVQLQGNVSGTGVFTIASPNSNTDRTLTLPDNSGTVLTQNSQPSFVSTIGVGGATPAASGAGITFPATQSASSDANTLDDYEEGTFTPTLSSWSGTYVSPATFGVYTKIGRVVTIFGQIVTTASSGTFAGGNTNVASLPFAGSWSSSGRSAAQGYYAIFSGITGLGASTLSSGPLDGPNNTGTDAFMNVFQTGTTAGNWANANWNAAASVTLRFSITYVA